MDSEYIDGAVTLPYSARQYVADQFMFCSFATGRDLQG
jgi:hypothetical protein